MRLSHAGFRPLLPRLLGLLREALGAGGPCPASLHLLACLVEDFGGGGPPGSGEAPEAEAELLHLGLCAVDAALAPALTAQPPALAGPRAMLEDPPLHEYALRLASALVQAAPGGVCCAGAQLGPAAGAPGGGALRAGAPAPALLAACLAALHPLYERYLCAAAACALRDLLRCARAPAPAPGGSEPPPSPQQAAAAAGVLAALSAPVPAALAGAVGGAGAGAGRPPPPLGELLYTRLMAGVLRDLPAELARPGPLVTSLFLLQRLAGGGAGGWLGELLRALPPGAAPQARLEELARALCHPALSLPLYALALDALARAARGRDAGAPPVTPDAHTPRAGPGAGYGAAVESDEEEE